MKKLIGWIKDAKYPEASLGVSFTCGKSEAQIMERAREMVKGATWLEFTTAPYVVTITTYAKQTVLRKETL